MQPVMGLLFDDKPCLLQVFGQAGLSVDQKPENAMPGQLCSWFHQDICLHT